MWGQMMNLSKYYSQFIHDPLGFACFNFPWGKKGTMLEKYDKPQKWQGDVLDTIGQALRSDPYNPIRIAVSAGHGVGKSALFSMISLWALSTKVNTRVVVTANTANQLKSKTMAELSRWKQASLNSDWWTSTSYGISFAGDEEKAKSWKLEAIAWSISSPESFAGLHNRGNRTVIIVDEASAVPESIFEVIEGAMTDEETEIIMVMLGNPTRASGRFFNAFHGQRNLFNRFTINSETVGITNKSKLKEWEETYGKDSDFYRVRVLGEFPNQADSQLIGTDIVREAMDRQYKLDSFKSAAKVIGVDVARMGNDSSTCWIRQGLYSNRLFSVNGSDTVAIAQKLTAVINEQKPDAVHIDAGNTGAALVDLLHSWNYKDVRGVFFAAKPSDDRVHLNKRAEMWVKMRDWIKDGGMLPRRESPAGRDLEPELTSLEYFYNSQGKIQLEAKKDMKARGLPSPDNADALALTFAYDVMPKAYITDNRLDMTTTSNEWEW